MMTKRLLHGFLLASIACSSGEDDARALCERVQVAICDGLKSCGCRLDVRDLTADNCVEIRTEDCVRAFRTRAIPDLEAKRVTIDEAAASACVGEIATLATSCEKAGERALPLACDLLFTDVAKAGEPCVIEGSGLITCAEGQGVCVDSGGDGPRTCVLRPSAGEPCAAGLCSSALRCVAGSCVEPAASVAKNAGEACVETSDCATGLRCDGVCVEAKPVGSSCSNADVCGASRVCGLSPEGRTCGDPAGEGEWCESGICARGLNCNTTLAICVIGEGEGISCVSGADCAAGLTCSDADHTCVRLPAQGETCAVGDRFCAEGLGCNEANRCEKGGGDGTACLLNPPEYVCAEGYGCDFTAEGSFCRPLAGAGVACETDRTCGLGFFCGKDQKCEAGLAEGAACPNGNECGQGLSCRRRGRAWQCETTPQRGEQCDFDCAGELVCRGVNGACVPAFCATP